MYTYGERSMFSIGPLITSGNRMAGESCQDNFRIICVSEGRGACSIDRCMQTVSAGQVICVGPHSSYHFIPGSGAAGHVITFSEAFLTQASEEPDGFHAAGLSLRFSLCPVVTLQPDVKEELPLLACKITAEYAHYYAMRSEILRRYLQIYLIHVLRCMEIAGGQAVPANVCMLLRKFTALLERHFKEKRLVADYAQQLGVSANHLNCVVKKYSGYPVSHFIRQRVVLEAKRKAIYSGFSMKEIAYDLGFDDTAHFSKYFKNVAGNNFSSFKKTISNELFSVT